MVFYVFYHFFFVSTLLHVHPAWTAGLVVDVSSANLPKAGMQQTLHCLTLLYGKGPVNNYTSFVNITEYEELWRSTQAFRFIGVCPDDHSIVGSLLELRALLTVFYINAASQQTCKIIKLTIPLTTTNDWNISRGSLNGFPRNATRSVYLTREGNLSMSNPTYHRNLSTVDILSEIELTKCSNHTRRLGFFIDVEGETDAWKLELVWRRKPEYYEVGEVGWSSVGAPIGALSGTFSLTELSISYQLDVKVFQDAHPSILNRPLFAESENASRFRARSGDFYQCESDRFIVLSPRLTSNKSINQDTALGQHIQVILATRDLRLQAFSDSNLNEFSGAGVTCSDDINEDHTLTIGIGVSVFVLVVVALFGIILTRLYDRDKELKTYELEQGFDPKKPGPLIVYPPSSQSKKRRRREKQERVKKQTKEECANLVTIPTTVEEEEQ